VSAVRQGNHKLIHAPCGEQPLLLYDLAADPAESVNLATKNPAQAEALLAQIKDWLQRYGTGCLVWAHGEGKERQVKVTIDAGKGEIVWASPVFSPVPDSAATFTGKNLARVRMQWRRGDQSDRAAFVQFQPGIRRARLGWESQGAPIPARRARLGQRPWPRQAQVDLLKVGRPSPAELDALAGEARPLLALWCLGPRESRAALKREGMSERTRQQLRALGYLR